MIFLEITSQTWVITLVGYGIVFIALVCLIIVFTYIPKILNILFNKRSKSKSDEQSRKSENNEYITGDDTAAIAMALHLFFEDQHDEESNIITIKTIQKRYSPWSSKIYGVRNFPNQ